MTHRSSTTERIPAAGTRKKWLLAVATNMAWTEAAAQAFRIWGQEVAKSHPGIEIEIEWLATEAHRRFTNSDAQPPFCAFLTAFSEPDFYPLALGSPKGMAVTILGLAPQPVFDRIRSEPGVPTPGLKKTTLWRARAELDPATWQARYRAHAEHVPSVHASAWRYCQNLIEEIPDGSDGPLYHAVSELWWPTEEDLLERFYASEEARRWVAEDTQGFIDIPSAVQTVTRHERVTRLR